MRFELLGDLVNVETFASGASIREHHIFDGQEMGAGRYEDACVSLAT